MQMQDPYDYESTWRGHAPQPKPPAEIARRRKEEDPEHAKKSLMRGIVIVVGIFLAFRGAYGFFGPDTFRLVPQITLGVFNSSQSNGESVEIEAPFLDDLPRLLIQDNLDRHPFSEERLLKIMCDPSKSHSFDREHIKEILAEMDVDWNENALKSAELTLERHPLSKARLYALLVDPGAHGFSEEQAQYAVDHVKTDWFDNALTAAKEQQEKEELPDEELFQRLTDPDSYAFSEEEAQWAVEQLKNPNPDSVKT